MPGPHDIVVMYHDCQIIAPASASPLSPRDSRACTFLLQAGSTKLVLRMHHLVAAPDAGRLWHSPPISRLQPSPASGRVLNPPAPTRRAAVAGRMFRFCIMPDSVLCSFPFTSVALQLHVATSPRLSPGHGGGICMHCPHPRDPRTIPWSHMHVHICSSQSTSVRRSQNAARLLQTASHPWPIACMFMATLLSPPRLPAHWSLARAAADWYHLLVVHPASLRGPRHHLERHFELPATPLVARHACGTTSYAVNWVLPGRRNWSVVGPTTSKKRCGCMCVYTRALICSSTLWLLPFTLL